MLCLSAEEALHVSSWQNHIWAKTIAGVPGRYLSRVLVHFGNERWVHAEKGDFEFPVQVVRRLIGQPILSVLLFNEL